MISFTKIGLLFEGLTFFICVMVIYLDLYHVLRKLLNISNKDEKDE